MPQKDTSSKPAASVPVTPVAPKEAAAPPAVAEVATPTASVTEAPEAVTSAVPGTETTALASTVPANADEGKKRILIVEDERPLARALELKVGHEGFATRVALTGTEGLQEALSGKYDCILLDLIMPEMDGFTMLTEMAAKGVKTPVIILSNLGQDEDKERAKTLGVVEYFVKANTPIVEIVKRMKTAIQ